ncbi:MAG TPA: hypothetical protein PKB10_10630 [Tepidisphaeraceae bacterium]|nr:hypothetical protein [Tepidisphaeraceae bacterium]
MSYSSTSRLERMLICYGALIGLIGTALIAMGIAATSDQGESFALVGVGAALLCPASLCMIWSMIAPLLAYERWRCVPVACVLANGMVVMVVAAVVGWVRG